MSGNNPFSEKYFAEQVPPRDELLLELEEEAEREGIPIVGPVVGNLLQLLALSSGARDILELGTATGYSGLFLARACAELGGTLLTLEANPDLAERARANFRRAGVESHVRVLEGGALETLQGLGSRSFDLAFLDIDKEDYEPALGQCRRILRERGLMVADNTSFPQSGDFNSRIYEDPAWRSVQLLTYLPGHSPEKDGICLAVREQGF
jgi:predicted O-methyltransferase YrrM